MAAFLGLGHAAANGLEDLRAAQLGNQQAEHISASHRVGFDIAARPGAPLDDAAELEVSQCPVDGRSRGRERPHHLGFARKSLTYLVMARGNGLNECLPNAVVF